MKTQVIIREVGVGGSYIDKIRDFNTLQEAQDFCTEFNAKNDLDFVPDWRMTAEIK